MAADLRPEEERSARAGSEIRITARASIARNGKWNMPGQTCETTVFKLKCLRMKLFSHSRAANGFIELEYIIQVRGS